MFSLLTGSRQSRGKTLTPVKRFMFTVNVLFQSDVWCCLVFEDALADGFWVISRCCRLCKQAVGTNSNQRQSGYIDVTVSCTWPWAPAAWSADSEPQNSQETCHQASVARCALRTGHWVLNAEETRWPVHSVQQGCRGGRMKEWGVPNTSGSHRTHTGYKSTPGTCILLSTLSCCPSASHDCK